MAGFKTHITTSTVLGCAYGSAAVYGFDVTLPSALLAGGLCSVSGMLPDLDSDSGVPLRESVAFAAAVVPMMMIRRFEYLRWEPESMVLFGAAIYLFIRFGLAKLLKNYTVHRGMFHSLPAALVATECAFLVCAHEELAMRYFFAGGVLLGFMSHLVLDEIWSIDLRHARLKKSSGTAIKLWGDSMWANFSVYAKVLVLTYLVFQDPVWTFESTPSGQNLREMAQETIDRFWK